VLGSRAHSADSAHHSPWTVRTLPDHVHEQAVPSKPPYSPWWVGGTHNHPAHTYHATSAPKHSQACHTHARGIVLPARPSPRLQACTSTRRCAPCLSARLCPRCTRLCPCCTAWLVLYVHYGPRLSQQPTSRLARSLATAIGQVRLEVAPCIADHRVAPAEASPLDEGGISQH